MWEQVNENEFDIIIDDGLHTLEAGINTFEKSFKKINKDGIYIIEDVDLCILKNLSNFFINTNINYEIISFSSNVMKLLKDSNLFIIKKNNNL